MNTPHQAQCKEVRLLKHEIVRVNKAKISTQVADGIFNIYTTDEARNIIKSLNDHLFLLSTHRANLEENEDMVPEFLINEFRIPSDFFVHVRELTTFLEAIQNLQEREHFGGGPRHE